MWNCPRLSLSLTELTLVLELVVYIEGGIYILSKIERSLSAVIVFVPLHS